MSTNPHAKVVAAGAQYGVATGVITWLLVSYVPVFHSGLPQALQVALPFVVGWAAHVAAALARARTLPPVILPPGTVINSAGLAVPPPATSGNVTVTPAPPKAAP